MIYIASTAALFNAFSQELLRRRLQKDSLRYAYKSDFGYKIDTGKSETWKELQEIIKKIRTSFPGLSEGELAEALFEYIHS